MKVLFARRVTMLVLFFLPVTATAGDMNLSVILRSTFTTASQVFTNPESSDPIERSRFNTVDNFFGGSVEVRYVFPETHFGAGLGVEYIRASQEIQTVSRIPGEDGYEVIPVELTGYFTIPISGPVISVYMGGGAGAYMGRRIYRLAGVEAVQVDRSTGFGIHILGGVGFRLSDLIMLTTELKFRDLQFESTNAFPVEQIHYNGRTVNVGTEPFTSRIHTDGMVLSAGIAFTF
jgi:preprotein translocase subunit Sss1